MLPLRMHVSAASRCPLPKVPFHHGHPVLGDEVGLLVYAGPGRVLSLHSHRKPSSQGPVLNLRKDTLPTAVTVLNPSSIDLVWNSTSNIFRITFLTHSVLLLQHR